MFRPIRADASEGVAHERDERAIAKTDQDRGTRFFILNRNGLEQDAHLLGRQHRRLSFLDTVLGPAHRVRRVERDDLAGDEPIEASGWRRGVA